MNKEALSSQTSLKAMIQTLTETDTGTLQGTVISINPLRIQMLNDDKHIITENIIIVPRHLTDYETTVDIELENGSIKSETSESGSHTHNYSGTTEAAGNPLHSHTYAGTTASKSHSHSIEIFNIYGAKMTVYNALKEGETVHLLPLNNGKKYYVLDRI